MLGSDYSRSSITTSGIYSWVLKTLEKIATDAADAINAM